MVPRPISEAWLLCAIANNYQHCAVLESASGSNNSPNPLKAQLARAIPGGYDLQWIMDQIETGAIDIDRIRMPSLDDFRQRFAAAVASANASPWPPPVPAPFQRAVRTNCL